MSLPVAIRNTGLVTSVGLDARSTCAAIRAKLTNPVLTTFMGSDGEWIVGHQVALDPPLRGLAKLTRMGALAIEECLHGVPRDEWPQIPLLLCVAEPGRPGRTVGLDDQLFAGISELLGSEFSPHSGILPQGRSGALVALAAAGRLLQQENTCERVVVAASDSLLTWPTLQVYAAQRRLLAPRNSNGFIPGEAGGALLLGRPTEDAQLLCEGVGFGVEPAALGTSAPLRAEGLSSAIQQALEAAGRGMHDLDFRITDLAGEHCHFKEAALALSRLLRQRKESFDLWHPAESTGETGSAAGVIALAVAQASCRFGFAPGPRILVHAGNDSGARAAAVLRFTEQR